MIHSILNASPVFCILNLCNIEQNMEFCLEFVTLCIQFNRHIVAG